MSDSKFGCNGYPDTPTNSNKMKTRGTGAATKGTMHHMPVIEKKMKISFLGWGSKK